MKFKNIIALALCTSSFVANTLSGQIGVGTITPDSSAALDIDVSSLPVTAKKGFLMPRVRLENNIDEITIPNPVNNLLIYSKENNGTAPNEIYGHFIYSWRGNRWDKFSNLSEVRSQKAPIDFAVAGKAKQVFSSSQVSTLNSMAAVNTVPIVWNPANDVIIANPADVILSGSTEIKILTTSLYQISGTVSFKPDAAGATNCVITLQKSSDDGATWTDIMGAVMPFETSIAQHNETIVFPDCVKNFQANDLIRFVVSRPKNPWTSGAAPANYGSNSGVQSRLDNDVNKSFRFTRLQE